MADYTLRDIQWLLNSPRYGLSPNSSARQARNEVQADWISEFMEKMSQTEDLKPTIANTHTTVESMVSELKERVGLSGLSKQAAMLGQIPLSKRATEGIPDHLTPALSAEMAKFLTNYHLKPSHGQLTAEACFDALKEKYGPEKVSKIGRDSLMKMIAKVLKENEEPSMIDSLPEYNGQPIPLKDEQESDDGQFGIKTH